MGVEMPPVPPHRPRTRIGPAQDAAEDQPAKHAASDERLYRLLRAYRSAKQENKESDPIREKHALETALHDLVQRQAGVTYERKGGTRGGAITGWRIGKLARENGMSDRAEELARRMLEKLERDAARSRLGYLEHWDESLGMSISTWIWRMGQRIVAEMNREALQDLVASGLPASRRGEVNNEERQTVRQEADQLAKAIKRGLSTVGRLQSVSIDELTSNEDIQRLAYSAETPIEVRWGHSKMRVTDKLIPRLKALGDEMLGQTVSVKAGQITLTEQCRDAWIAYLGLSDTERLHLDESIETLAKRKNWPLKQLKVHLAACFCWLQQHPNFDDICDLMLPARATKHMDAAQLAASRQAVKHFLADTDAERKKHRAKFRSAIHYWIDEYGAA